MFFCLNVMAFFFFFHVVVRSGYPLGGDACGSGAPIISYSIKKKKAQKYFSTAESYVILTLVSELPFYLPVV